MLLILKFVTKTEGCCSIQTNSSCKVTFFLSDTDRKIFVSDLQTVF